MSRRFKGTRRQVAGIADDTTPAEEMALLLAASNRRNAELCAEVEKLRAEAIDADAARKQYMALEQQLSFCHTELADAKRLLGVAESRVEMLERTASADAAALKREREHNSASCSHAAELRDLNRTVTALGRRVAELQRINEGYESPEWQPRPETVALPSVMPVRAALGRGKQ